MTVVASRSTLDLLLSQLLRPLLPVQYPNGKCSGNQTRGDENHGDEPLLVPRRLNLLPNQQRQPRLHDIGHLIHGADDQSPLLVVVAADLVRPRHVDAGDAAADRAENQASPLPPVGDVPGRHARVGDDVGDAGKHDAGPSLTAEHRVGGPGVDEREDNLHRGRQGRIRVNGRDRVALALEPERKDGLAAVVGAVVEEHVQQCQEIDVPAAEDLLELGLAVAAAVGPALELHALLGQLDLGRLEPPRPRDLGHVGEEEEAGDGDRQADDGVDDEEPLPASVALDAVEFVGCRHQVAGEHGADRARHVEDTRAFR